MYRPLAALALASSLFTRSAQAQPPGVYGDTMAHRHLGFSLHLDLGFGYMNSSVTDQGTDEAIKGGEGQFSIAIGGAVAENLVLAGHVWGALATSPDFTIGSQTSGSSSDTTLTLTGIGPNLTYWIMPANIFLSVTPSVTRVNLKIGGVEGSTDAGFGTHFAIGKEWWVGDHWGLGLAGQFYFGLNKDQGADSPTWTTLGGSLAFSATYN